MCKSKSFNRAFTMILVIVIGRQEIEQLVNPFGSIFLLTSKTRLGKNAKYREIRQKYFQIHVDKTYLILILAIRPVLFTPNVQI